MCCRYYAIIGSQFGEDAKLVIEELARVGQISLTKLMFVMGSKFRKGDSKPDENAIREKLTAYYSVFKKLTKDKYCIRCEAVVSGDEALVPIFKPGTSEEERFVPNIDLNWVFTKIVADTDIKELKDSDIIIWKVDATTFHLEMKNQLLVDSMRRRLLTLGEERVFKAILNIGLRRDPYAVSTPAVSIVELKEELLKLADGEVIVKYLDQHIEMMGKSTFCVNLMN